MGKTIQLAAVNGLTPTAYRADPKGRPRGGLVVIQEVFGVNPHMS